ncbi:MAG: flagellar hook assembly protein FlgD [Verrucomicrobia bacterium]|nr:flagellar hook assembly protein FlgD [Verrucomicrobiota bacterium]
MIATPPITNDVVKSNIGEQSRIPTKLLNQDDFLKLVVAQMTNQDPLKPRTDTEFIAQMTQFTTLEQTKNMQSDIAQMRAQQQLLRGMSLLDRVVQVQSGDASPVTGVVKGLEMDGDNPKILIGEQAFDLNDIISIRPANQN